MMKKGNLPAAYLFSFLLLTSLLTGCSLSSPSDNESGPEVEKEEAMRNDSVINDPGNNKEMLQAETMKEEQTEAEKVTESKKPSIEITEKEAALYEGYSSALYEAYVGKEPFVLFFYASWCPDCRTQDAGITENLSSFPEGTKILKVDYDKEAELKKKYGVTIQTTFVIVNAMGEKANILLNPSLEALKAEVDKTLI